MTCITSHTRRGRAGPVRSIRPIIPSDVISLTRILKPIFHGIDRTDCQGKLKKKKGKRERRINCYFTAVILISNSSCDLLSAKTLVVSRLDTIFTINLSRSARLDSFRLISSSNRCAQRQWQMSPLWISENLPRFGVAFNCRKRVCVNISIRNGDLFTI